MLRSNYENISITNSEGPMDASTSRTSLESTPFNITPSLSGATSPIKLRSGSDETDNSFTMIRTELTKGIERRLRTMSELQITDDVKAEDLITMYKETESLEEQGDILHYLVYNK